MSMPLSHSISPSGMPNRSMCDGRACPYSECSPKCFITGWRSLLTKAQDHPYLVHSRGRFHEALAEVERLDGERKR
jgi:hypothetical protein